MTGWADANYAARLDLEENSLTRIKNVHIFNIVDDASKWMDFAWCFL